MFRGKYRPSRNGSEGSAGAAVDQRRETFTAGITKHSGYYRKLLVASHRSRSRSAGVRFLRCASAAPAEARSFSIRLPTSSFVIEARANKHARKSTALKMLLRLI